MMYEAVQFEISGAEKEVRIKDLKGFDFPCLFMPYSIGDPDEIVSHFAVVAEYGTCRSSIFVEWLEETFGEINGELSLNEVYCFEKEKLSYAQSRAILEGYRAMLNVLNAA